jgi:hypothetical protein
VEPVRSFVAPRPAIPSHDTPYYRNVRIEVRDGALLVTDSAGNAHLLRAGALAWVTADATRARLLVLDKAGSVLADIDPDGWDLDELADFGDAVGVPLIEEVYADGLTARAAYPLPSGALRIHAKDIRALLLQFLPVLLPVVVIIVLAVVLAH